MCEVLEDVLEPLSRLFHPDTTLLRHFQVVDVTYMGMRSQIRDEHAVVKSLLRKLHLAMMSGFAKVESGDIPNFRNPTHT
jgi:hypothetical protein